MLLDFVCVGVGCLAYVWGQIKLLSLAILLCIDVESGGVQAV
jgi:hypothetical protein